MGSQMADKGGGRGRTAEQAEPTVAELRARLAEAEDTLRAIRDGEIDALVVNQTGQEKVFMLQGGPEAYRAFMENMNQGAVALDAEGRILYANGMFLALAGTTLDEAYGVDISRYLYCPAWQAAAAEMSADPSVRKTFEAELEDGQGGRMLLLSVAPLAIGLVDGWAVTASDITEERRREQAAESERTAHAIIESANEAVVVCDIAGIVTHANPAVAALTGWRPIGRRIDEVVDVDLWEGDARRTVGEIVARAVAGVPTQGLEATVSSDALVSAVLVSAAPLRVSGSRIVGCVLTMTDVSARKAAEEQQALLMAEMDHRVKNTLSVVLAICGLTVTRHTTLDSFRHAFESRIRALAETHNLLADNRWQGVSLASVIKAELIPFMGAGRDIRIAGPAILLTPRAGLALGLLFHELVTNAVKYGALSVRGGHLECRWEPLAADDEEQRLRLVWTESGGPPVVPPDRRGFGCTLIERGLSSEVGGAARIDFRPEGVRCEIELPGREAAVQAA